MKKPTKGEMKRIAAELTGIPVSLIQRVDVGLREGANEDVTADSRAWANEADLIDLIEVTTGGHEGKRWSREWERLTTGAVLDLYVYGWDNSAEKHDDRDGSFVNLLTNADWTVR